MTVSRKEPDAVSNNELLVLYAGVSDSGMD
jgi:hypothetical protein